MIITTAPTTAPIMVALVLSESMSSWLPGVVLSGKKSKNDQYFNKKTSFIFLNAYVL